MRINIKNLKFRIQTHLDAAEQANQELTDLRLRRIEQIAALDRELEVAEYRLSAALSGAKKDFRSSYRLLKSNKISYPSDWEFQEHTLEDLRAINEMITPLASSDHQANDNQEEPVIQVVKPSNAFKCSSKDLKMESIVAKEIAKAEALIAVVDKIREEESLYRGSEASIDLYRRKLFSAERAAKEALLVAKYSFIEPRKSLAFKARIGKKSEFQHFMDQRT